MVALGADVAGGVPRESVMTDEYPEPNSPDDLPGDADVPEEPNTEVTNDPVDDGGEDE